MFTGSYLRTLDQQCRINWPKKFFAGPDRLRRYDVPAGTELYLWEAPDKVTIRGAHVSLINSMIAEIGPAETPEVDRLVGLVMGKMHRCEVSGYTMKLSIPKPMRRLLGESRECVLVGENKTFRIGPKHVHEADRTFDVFEELSKQLRARTEERRDRSDKPQSAE